MDDHGEMSEEEQALEDAKRVLDDLPAEQVRQLILETGAMEAAVAALTELADSDDPTVREDARAALDRFKLG
ncbi:hypothetical protein ACOCJ7_00120 [Knoellia sp. CPCC 206453]|uniref:hypothetical protein n=1 Tax=Knoellia pratensis TaxID=3404796 RepID=UPI0036098272